MAKSYKRTTSADAANSFVRNILSEVSDILGGFSTAQWEETRDFFDKRCAYTGEEIGSLEKDHIIPMNRTHGGLHIHGNVVPASPEANRQKSGKTLDEFFASEASCLSHMSQQERAERKARIEKFQELCKYHQRASLLSSDFTEKLREKYLQIQSLSDEYITELSSSIEVASPIGKVLVEKVYKNKVDRIFAWARKPTQNSHIIVRTFLEHRNKSLSPNDFIEVIKRMNVSVNPYGAVRSMMTNAGNSYGKIFMDDDGVLILVPELQPKLKELLIAFGVD